jgi:hypothetical protein
MSRSTPPAGSEKPRARGSLHRLKVCTIKTRINQSDELVRSHTGNGNRDASCRARAEKRTGREKKRNLTLWVSTEPELVLLEVGSSEDVVAEALDSEDAGDGSGGELGLVEGEVAGLEAVTIRRKMKISVS